MTIEPFGASHPLGMIGHLSKTEWRQLSPLFKGMAHYTRGTVISKPGDWLNHSLLMTDGIVGRSVQPVDSDRGSLVAFQVPGDFVDLHAYPMKRLDHGVVALTQVRMAVIEHEKLSQLLRENAELARKLWALTLVDAAIHRHWVMRNSSLRAMARMANMFAELDARLTGALHRAQDCYDIAITQIDLSDACGLTPIHVNRILRDLREDGCCTFKSGQLTIHDRARLRALGQFDPTYLYLPGDADLL